MSGAPPPSCCCSACAAMSAQAQSRALLPVDLVLRESCAAAVDGLTSVSRCGPVYDAAEGEA